MIIFISGKITGDKNYRKKFAKKAKELKAQGHLVLNPAAIISPDIEYEEQMDQCFTLISMSHAVYFLKDYKESSGSCRELKKAIRLRKQRMFEEENLLNLEVEYDI